ncbi:MAG: hypothetical protein MR517_09455 [Bacteroidales bacterium]|nr:hypothetical protein [Bacteroidales bacterium]
MEGSLSGKESMPYPSQNRDFCLHVYGNKGSEKELSNPLDAKLTQNYKTSLDFTKKKRQFIIVRRTNFQFCHISIALSFKKNFETKSNDYATLRGFDAYVQWPQHPINQ